MDIAELRTWDELFSTDGWKKLTAEAQVEVDNLATRALHDAKAFEDVAYFRGQAASLFNLIHLEDSILNQAKAEREEAEDDDDADV